MAAMVAIAGVSLVAPIASAAGTPATAPALSIDPSSSADAPLVLLPGERVTFTVSNAVNARSTAVLVVSLSGDGFSLIDDGCGGTALGPRRSCTVTIGAPDTPSTITRTASITVAGRITDRVALVTAFVAVEATTPPPPPPSDPPPPAAPQPPSDIDLRGTIVDENVAGAVVGAIEVTDPDAGDVHQVSISDPRFEVVQGTLRLRSGIAFDAEVDGASVFIMITATDSHGLQRSESAVITVNDVNEAPGLRVRVFASSVSGSVSGVGFASVFTSDPDAGDTVTVGTTDPRFEVAGSSLQLRAGHTIDPSVEPTVTFEVVATDRGGLSASSTVRVTITP
jgi:hypothetical protein